MPWTAAENAASSARASASSSAPGCGRTASSSSHGEAGRRAKRPSAAPSRQVSPSASASSRRRSTGCSVSCWKETTFHAGFRCAAARRCHVSRPASQAARTSGREPGAGRHADCLRPCGRRAWIETVEHVVACAAEPAELGPAGEHRERVAHYHDDRCVQLLCDPLGGQRLVRRHQDVRRRPLRPLRNREPPDDVEPPPDRPPGTPETAGRTALPPASRRSFQATRRCARSRVEKRLAPAEAAPSVLPQELVLRRLLPR